jgi:hypothetical protein
VLKAHQKPITLSEWSTAFSGLYPHEPGNSTSSLSATVGFHTVNMRSRFNVPTNKNAGGTWRTEPLFKRTTRGLYMLLSAQETQRFHQLMAEQDPRLFQEEFDASALLG